MEMYVYISQLSFCVSRYACLTKSPCSWGQSPARLGFPRQCVLAVDGIGALRRCRPPCFCSCMLYRKSVPLCSVQVIFMRSMSLLHVGYIGMNPTCRAVCSRAGTCIYTFACCFGLYKLCPSRSTHGNHGMALSTELVAELSAKLSQVQEGDRLVKTVHAAIAQLESRGHVYSMQLAPAMVGISRQNRDGSGINPVDVHDLLGDNHLCRLARLQSSGNRS